MLDLWSAFPIDERREGEKGSSSGLALSNQFTPGRLCEAWAEPQLVCRRVGMLMLILRAMMIEAD